MGPAPPLFAPLLADPEIAALFSAEAQLAHLLAFEVELTRARTGDGPLVRRMASFRPDPEALAAATRRDGLPVPAFVTGLKAHVAAEPGLDAPEGAIHAGATSQDLLDTALALTLRGVTDILGARLDALLEALAALADRFGDRPLMARTRMQAALPVTAGDRIALWADPLRELRAEGEALRPRVERLQFAGPVGTGGGAEVAALAAALGLAPALRSWQTDRRGLAAYAGWLSALTGALGKMGQDVCLMAQQRIDEIALAGGGGSSAMPHKANPVAAETLVALARANAVAVSGMHHALVHEQERSGAAWTLEWLTLPGMAERAGAATASALRLVAQVERIGDPA